jgi:2-oxo-3-hexenedioate decarboxylase
MTPQALLEHYDHGQLWACQPGETGSANLDQAYQQALAVRRLRIERGERPTGYKIGFTNRTIWSRYNVFAPVWGTVWDTTLRWCDGAGELSLANTCQPRLEPEVVFGMRSTPKADAGLEDLFDAVDWVAPGFEVVQCHLPDWKFTAPDVVADSALHTGLLVGTRIPVRELASSAAELDRVLAQAKVELLKDGQAVEQGTGANVLDSPLQALLHFLAELRRCPGAADLQAGDVITTGTWTDAWSIQPGETWTARFTPVLGTLSIILK